MNKLFPPVTCLILIALLAAIPAGLTAAEASDDGPRLRAASLRFGVLPQAGGETESRTGAVVGQVHGPLKTTVTLLADGPLRLCLIASDSSSIIRRNMATYCRREIAEVLDLPVSHVLIFSSHNHSGTRLASNQTRSYDAQYADDPEPDLLPVGREFMEELRGIAGRLPGMLRPVSVWWAEGREGRITYNRKGRRADGSTYFMREEDRILVGKDFRGDIDQQAPVVVLKDAEGKPVTALVQFTGHPVTSYHPEKPVVFGEWPQVACDMLAEHLSPSQPVPVGFLQGCAGDVNSKKMFRGGVETATQYGRMLGTTYIEALDDLKPSQRGGLDYSREEVEIPLAPLPSPEVLRAEIAEMEAFLRRAADGDEDTLTCVGLNFPRDLSPAYRGKLIELVLPWSRWALGLHENGKADTAAKSLKMDLYVIRLGDVAIVGMPCEPFQGIGRLIRRDSPLPLAIPCGYVNYSHGYITDAPNTGDREYTSAFYRYTRFRPPLAKPAGDVLADRAAQVLKSF
jgi:hypothetical protein